VRLRTKRDGPVLRSQIRLPHSVKTDIKIAVICPPDSIAARQAREAGATLVGEEEVFEVFKSGKIDIDRCIAQPGSLAKLNQAGLGRILGPRGLMPSAKLGTVVEGVGNAVKAMLGGSMYRERMGVVRMAIGQLGFTPEQLRDNLKAFVAQLKKDASNLSEQATKEIHEVVRNSHYRETVIVAYTLQVLSSTNSPGFSLNGEFKSDKTPPLDQLSR
jgi:large subunit ribosomal protein L1